ncbi:MAG: helix-turn-helix domain-containing protein [Lachnospiraceae bacterium]|nr:helix-turn-helix domain-containing protein [Lachnospiraceae bacterium]
MITNQVIRKCIEDIRSCSGAEISVFETSGMVAASTLETQDIEPESIRNFYMSPADSQVIGEHQLFRIRDEEETLFVLVIKGGDDAGTIGKMTTLSLESLVVAYKERFDKNNFFQNLLLDNMLSVDIYNQARKLRIPTDVTRVVYIIEPQPDKGSSGLEFIRSLYADSENDFVTAVDERNVILIKTVDPLDEAEIIKQEEPDEEAEGDEEIIERKDPLSGIAKMLASTMNSELMVKARVSYGTAESDIRRVSLSYKEARMALEVGKVFYPERDVVGYNSLGIGRLVYQLQPTLCDIFLHEVFGENIPKQFDDETLITVNKFFENSLNVSETSRQLFVHRNTLVYRIEKLEKMTGLDIRKFDDALTLKMALMVMDYMRYINSR